MDRSDPIRAAGVWRPVAVLCGVFLIVQIVPELAALAANRWSVLFTSIDPDGTFVWLSIHHVVQLLVALVAIALWRRGALPRWGFNLHEWKTSLRWFGWFALCCTLGMLLFGIGPHLLRGTTPALGFPLTSRNLAGRLGFYYLLSGAGEEPLYRGFVMSVLLLYWRREFRLGKLVLPAVALWTTAIFMLAHVNHTWRPFHITDFSLPQQAFCLGFGLYYAAALHRTRSLLCPILAHGFSNGIIFTLLYALAWWNMPPSIILPPDFATGKAGDPTLTNVLEEVRAANKLPALAAVSMTSAGIIEMAAVGVRAEGFPEQVTLEDQWDLGSIARPMTATLAARLVEKGILSWQTTLEEAFGDLEDTMRPEYRTVRLEELLHHVSGIPRDVSPERLCRYDQRLPVRDQRRALVAEVLALPPATPRGTLAYSNLGFIVAGVMMEQREGTSFEDLMTREVFTPLGMTHSGFGPPGTPGRRDQPWAHYPPLRLAGAREQARGIGGSRVEEYLSAGQPARGIWQALDPGRPAADIPPTESPCGRVHTTLGDIAKFAAAHLAGARGDTPFLSAASFRKLHSPPDESGYALDWVVSRSMFQPVTLGGGIGPGDDS